MHRECRERLTRSGTTTPCSLASCRQAGPGAAPEASAAAVQACDRVATDLAAQQATRMQWVSGGVTLGTREDHGVSSKRQKLVEDASDAPGARAPLLDTAQRRARVC
jgi:hypothetical protein